MTDLQLLRIERLEDAIARVTVACGDSGNASTPELLDELRLAFEALGADAEVRAILFAAEGKHFSVGADFSFLRTLTAMAPAEIKATVYGKFQGAARAIYRCPKPTIALVQGAAITVGCELALACDFRIAAENARFQESWIKLGLMPPLGGLFFLPRLIGLGRAMDMCLRAKPVLASEALQIGLVGEIVSIEELNIRGLEFARELAASAPAAYASVKQSLQRAVESNIDSEWQAAVSNQAILIASDDFKEGLSAVVEKRAPQFAGR